MKDLVISAIEGPMGQVFFAVTLGGEIIWESLIGNCSAKTKGARANHYEYMPKDPGPVSFIATAEYTGKVDSAIVMYLDGKNYSTNTYVCMINCKKTDNGMLTMRGLVAAFDCLIPTPREMETIDFNQGDIRGTFIVKDWP